MRKPLVNKRYKNTFVSLLFSIPILHDSVALLLKK